MRPIIFFLTASLALASCKKGEREVHPELRRLTQAVYASGTLQPEQEYEVVAAIDGYLQQAWVKEGDRVRDGQPLFRLSSPERETALRNATLTEQRTAALSSKASPRIAELREQLRSASARLATDSDLWLRYQRLYQQNAVSRSSYDRYYLQYQTSLHERERIEAAIRTASLSAELEWQGARNGLASARTQTDQALIRSASDGKVYEVLKQSGDRVAPGQPIARVGSERLLAKLLVDEDDLGKLSLGQPVYLTMDAWEGRVFRAHLTRIYPLLNRVEQSFRVDAELDDPIPAPMYGLNLEANIIVSEAREVRVIPRAALLKGDSVWVKTAGKIEKLHIETGISDNEWVELRSKLDPSSTIIIRP